MYVNTKLRPIIYFFIDQVAIAYTAVIQPCSVTMVTSSVTMVTWEHCLVSFLWLFCSRIFLHFLWHVTCHLFIVLIHCTTYLFLAILLKWEILERKDYINGCSTLETWLLLVSNINNTSQHQWKRKLPVALATFFC